MKLAPYVDEAADNVSKTIIEKKDAAYKLILMHLADKNRAVPCFELDFLSSVADEREQHEYVKEMSNSGLVEIIESEYNFLRTPLYRIMPYGKAVAERVKALEEQNGNPSINYFFEKTTRGVLKERYPQFAEQIDALEESIFSIGARAAEVLSI